MKAIIHGTHSKGDGYTLWLSARNTQEWALGEWPSNHGKWPCSSVSNRRLRIEVDSTGLVDITVNGRYSDSIDGAELDAIVADSISSIRAIQHLWPLWGRYQLTTELLCQGCCCREHPKMYTTYSVDGKCDRCHYHTRLAIVEKEE